MYDRAFRLAAKAREVESGQGRDLSASAALTHATEPANLPQPSAAAPSGGPSGWVLMASNRTWVRELNGELVWIREVEGRLILSNRMAADTGTDYREFSRRERIAWRLIRRPPTSLARTQ